MLSGSKARRSDSAAYFAILFRDSNKDKAEEGHFRESGEMGP